MVEKNDLTQSAQSVSPSEVDSALLGEIRQRLIHIEHKLNQSLMEGLEKDPVMLGHVLSDSMDREQVFGSRTFAQHGDDIVIAIIFEMMGIKNPSYIDIGAHHPFVISNTALFYRRGSRGINVEANPSLIDAFKLHRPEDVNLNVGVSDQAGNLTFYKLHDKSGLNTFDPDRVKTLKEMGYQVTETIEVPVITISEIIDKYAGGVFPDFLSLDVEGFDIRIIRSIPFEKYHPKLICIEANSLDIGKEMFDILTKAGYKLYFRSMENLHFLRREYLAEYDMT